MTRKIFTTTCRLVAAMTFLTVCFLILFAGSLQAADVVFVELTGHIGAVSSAAFSPIDSFVVTTSEDKTARIWDAGTQKEMQKLDHPGAVEYAAFLPDGKKVVTSCWDDEAFEPSVRIWDVQSGKQLYKMDGTPLATSQDGKRIVAQSAEDDRILVFRIFNVDSGKVQTIKLKDGRLLAGMPVFSPDEAKTVSPDGRRIVTITGNRNDDLPPSVQIWDTDTGRVLRTLSEPQPRVGVLRRPVQAQEESYPALAAIFSSDGKKIATLSMDKIVIWDADKGTVLFKLEGISADFSPDGKIIATTDGENVQLWNADTGRKVAEVEGVFDLIFSPDGKRIITESLEDGVRMWEVQSGKELYKMEDMPTWFSPDGNFFAQSNFFPHASFPNPDTDAEEPTTTIYFADSGRELYEWEGGFLAFSQDSRIIATANRDFRLGVRLTAIREMSGAAPQPNPVEGAKDITGSVEEFLSNQGWPGKKRENAVQALIQVEIADRPYDLFYLVRKEEEQLIVYASVREKVAESHRAAVMEYLTRVNYAKLRIGNIEMDLSDGEVRFRVSTNAELGVINPKVVEQLSYLAMGIAELLLPGIEDVIDGTTPEDALGKITN